MQLRLLQKNKEEKDMIIAVAGSGGKTTRVHKLAQYYRSLGKKVFVTTTTHMKKESDTVIPENIEDIRKQLNETGYCMAGMPATPENAHSPTSSTALAWKASRSTAVPSTIGPSTKR